MTTERWCGHCDIDLSERRDGVCQACAAYRRKYGELPSIDVVARRVERRDTARLERLALGLR